MFARRSLSALATSLSTRAYTTARGTTSSSFSNYEAHGQVEVGDLVTYVEAGNRTEGIVQKIFEESSKTEKKPSHLAQVQNYYTRKVSYSDLGNLQSVARQQKAAAATAKASATKATTTAATATTKSTTTSAAVPKPTTTTPSSAQPNKPSQASDAKNKLNKQLKAEDSPLNADYAAGDIVRYRVAQNFTAGVILDIVYTNTHDEHGNFHGATKENPMAKLENLWTKNITYHHLNVLEHVKRARDVTPGRFAESEYEVYNKK